MSRKVVSWRGGGKEGGGEWGGEVVLEEGACT